MAPSNTRIAVAERQYDDALKLLEAAMDFGAPEYSEEWWGKAVVHLVRDLKPWETRSDLIVATGTVDNDAGEHARFRRAFRYLLLVRAACKERGEQSVGLDGSEPAKAMGGGG